MYLFVNSQTVDVIAFNLHHSKPITVCSYLC